MERPQEPVEEPAGAEREPAMRLVSERHAVRRRPGSKLVLAGLVVPALLAAGAGLVSGPGAEEALMAQGTSALTTGGLAGVKLEANGPFVNASVPTRINPAVVERVVAGVDGVSAVTTEQVYSSKKERQICANLDKKLDRATGGQRIPFSGESARLTSRGTQMVREAAKLVAACGTAKVYVGGHVDSRTPDGSTLSLRRARGMIDLMRRAGTPKERLVPRGYGAQYPIAEGESRSDRLRNQRGSITLVEG